jgi:sugar phosphate isomerase/epimerase
MVHFAVSSMFFHEYPIDEIFDYIEETGLDGIEFWMETPHFWLNNCIVDDLDTSLQEHPGLCSFNMHAPILDLNPCSINPRVAQISRQYALETIAIARHLGAEVVTVHPGRRTVKRVPSANEYERFELFLSELKSVAQGKHVKISIENMEPTINSLLCTPDAMRDLLDVNNWLYFTLDTSHALAGYSEQVIEYISLCHDRLVNIHVSRVENDRMHSPIYGSNDLDGAFQNLAEMEYKGSLTLEIEDRNFDHDLSAEERITLLIREVEFMEQFFS